MNAERFCAICHQPEFDANGLRHADVSSGHTFAPEGRVELHEIDAAQLRRGDVLLDAAYDRLGTITHVDDEAQGTAGTFAVMLDGEECLSFGAGEMVAVLRSGCEECDWRGWVLMNHDDDPEGTPAHVERCDTCKAFANDDDAEAAAQFVGELPVLPS